MCIFNIQKEKRQAPATTTGGRSFVHPQSIVRRIWGSSDVVLFIFAGAAAEFALNKAVDWLYFTGKLPEDPLGRLFSTVDYARAIIFAGEEEAEAAIDRIAAIHRGVEEARGAQIPAWAYRDVLYMLIEYSVSAWELLERPLLPAEREEVYDVFRRVGRRMGIPALPPTYTAWLPDRASHMRHDLAVSPYTAHLFGSYRQHLGWARYYIMRQVQAALLPRHISRLLGMKYNPAAAMALVAYRNVARLALGRACKQLLLPAAYKERILALDRA